MRIITLLLALITPVVAAIAEDIPSGIAEQRIAYARQGTPADVGIYISTLSGKRVKRVAEVGMMPQWSPDGTKLSYLGFRLEAGIGVRPTLDLYVYDLQTSKTTKLTDSRKGQSVLIYTWSPDATRIAYALSSQAEKSLVIVELDSGKRTTIVPSQSTICAEDPSWSPDGKKLAVRLCGAGQRGIALIDTQGTHLIRLTQPVEGQYDGMPVWSPDGKRIAFASDRDDTPKRKGPVRRSLYVMNADGSGLHPLVRHKSANVMWPSWSTDGTMIAYELSAAGTLARFGAAAYAEAVGTKVVIMRLSDGKILATLMDGSMQPALAPSAH